MSNQQILQRFDDKHRRYNQRFNNNHKRKTCKQKQLLGNSDIEVNENKQNNSKNQDKDQEWQNEKIQKE